MLEKNQEALRTSPARWGRTASICYKGLSREILSLLKTRTKGEEFTGPQVVGGVGARGKGRLTV